MSEHVTDWIAAYHDGELGGARREQVDAHLRQCAACRAELERFEEISAWLKTSPPMPARTHPEQFVSQVRLRLRPQPAPPDRMRVLSAVWRLLPLGLLAGWAFLQAVLIVSGALLAVLPLFGGLPGTGTLEWRLAEAMAGWLVLDLGLTAVTAALAWGWLAGWWAARQRRIRSSGEIAG
jgi:hypothetical protein